MSKIGYARVSSKEQNLDRQLEALQSVSKVFSDKASGQSTERPQLQAMLDYLREGDIVIVTELDRLGRNNKDLTEIMNAIQQKGATLEVLNLPSMNGIEDENLRRLINNLVVELYKYQAESERPSGTSPATIRCASPSTIAVLPVPGSPIRTGLFFVRRESTWITRRISSSRPITGSSLPLSAASVRSRPNFASAW